MKHKFVKIAVIAAITAIAAGGVCLGAGLAMGGSPSFYYDKNGIHVKENAASEKTQDHVMEYTKIDALKNLDISLVDAEFTIVSGKEWAVEYVLSGYRMEPEYSLEDGTLTIRENRSSQAGQSHTFGWGHYWWFEGEPQQQGPYVKITVPDTGTPEQVTIASEYGDVWIGKDLKARNVCVDTENGDVELDGWEGDSISFEMRYGCLTAGNLEGRSVTVKNGNGAVKTGDLKVDSADFDMEYGSLTAGNLEGRSISVKNENGAVRMGDLKADSADFDMKYGDLTTGALESKALTVKNESGTVKMDTIQVETAEFTMEYGNLSATVKEASSLEVDNDNGSVTFGLTGGMEKYGVSLHTDWGKIRTPQGVVEPDGHEGGSDFIRTVDDIAGIRIYTEYGDIRMRDEA